MSHQSTSVIYVLSNIFMPNIYKIGCTNSQENIEKRMAELYTTAVPYEFCCEYIAQVNNAFQVEATLHEVFKSYRINQSREFFEVELATIIRLLQLVEHKNKKTQHKKIREKKLKLKLKSGAILSFIEDEKITVEVIFDDTVLYENKVIQLKTLTAKLTNKNMNNAWKLDNQLLKDIA